MLCEDLNKDYVRYALAFALVRCPLWVNFEIIYMLGNNK